MRPAIRPIDPLADARFDRFVHGHRNATVYHLPAWARLLSTLYGDEPVYLAAEDPHGNIRGVLPLVLTRGVVSGARMNSLPLEGVAGPLASSREDEAALVAAACALTRERDATRLEFRSTTRGYDDLNENLEVAPGRPIWVIDLPPDAEELRARWPRNLQRDVDKADAADLTVRQGDAADDLRSFYRMYLETMRKHRAVPRSLRHLGLARDLLAPSGAHRLLLVERQGTPVAGGIFHTFGDSVEVVYTASNRRFLDLRPNHALYSCVLRWAIEHGFRRFDWGGCSTSSLEWFKRRWSAEPVAVYHHTYSPDARVAGVERLHRLRSRLQSGEANLLARAWGRTPLGLTRLAGRLVYRYL
jgi:hypothetical protein